MEETKAPPNPLLDIDFNDAKFLLWKYKYLILIVPICLSIVGGFLESLLPPVYSSKSVFFVNPNFYEELKLGDSVYRPNATDTVNSMAEAIVSDSVILEVINELDLRNNPEFIPSGSDLSDSEMIEKVRNRYSARIRPASRLMELTVKDRCPETVISLSEAIPKTFISHLGRERVDKRATMREALELQSKKTLQRALQAENVLKGFRSENPSMFADENSTVIDDKISMQSNSIGLAQNDVARLAGYVEALKNVDPNVFPHRVFQIIDSDETTYYSNLLSMESEARSDLADVEERFTRRNVNYAAALSRLNNISGSIIDYAIETKNSVNSEYESAKAKLGAMQSNFVDLQENFIDSKSISAEFKGLNAEVNRYWDTHQSLHQKLMELDVEPEVPPSILSTVSYPLNPTEPDGKFLIMVVGGFVLGLGAVLMYILLTNLGRLPFTVASQAISRLGIPMVGRIDSPDIMSDLSDTMVVVRNSKIINFTCPNTNANGKKVSLAMAQKSVEAGLKTVHVSIFENGELAQEVNRGKLTLTSIHSHILFEPEKFEQNLKQARESFDRIIFDSTEVKSNTIKATLSRFADDTILIIEGAGDTPRAKFQVFNRALLAVNGGKQYSLFVSTKMAKDLSKQPSGFAGLGAAGAPKPQVV